MHWINLSPKEWKLHSTTIDGDAIFSVNSFNYLIFNLRFTYD
jgi:hypothetical protein